MQRLLPAALLIGGLVAIVLGVWVILGLGYALVAAGLGAIGLAVNEASE